jgi:hypothetical protein
MAVVAYQVAVDIRGVQQGGHGIVKGLYGPPASMEEIVTPGMKLPPGGHTGKASGITAVKTTGFFTQARKIRRMNPGIAIIGQKMAV